MTGMSSAGRVPSVRPRLVWCVVVALLLATAALGATRGRTWWQERQVGHANAAALAAGRQLAVNFTTVDYRTVDADSARVKAEATGGFLASYSQSLKDLRSLVVTNKTVSRVERAEAALVSGDRDSAQVIVGLVAPTSNVSVPAGETKTYRMKLSLRAVGGSWKVENLEFVG